MITIEDAADRYERKSIRVSQGAEDKSNLFQISLLTSDIPPKFEQTRDRKITVEIVEGPMDNIDVPTDSIVMPIVLAAVSNLNDSLRAYYSSSDDVSAGVSPHLQFNGYVTYDKGASLPKNPHIVITFCILSSNGDTSVDNVHHQQIDNGNRDQSLDLSNVSGGYDSRRHVDDNENANGGLDLPVNEQKSDLKQEEREGKTFNYDTGGKPEVVDA